MYMYGTYIPNSVRATHEVAGRYQRRKVTVGPFGDDLHGPSYVLQYVLRAILTSLGTIRTSLPGRHYVDEVVQRRTKCSTVQYGITQVYLLRRAWLASSLSCLTVVSLCPRIVHSSGPSRAESRPSAVATR